MTDERTMELLKRSVDHIESFEEDASEIVLKALGFTNEELAEIKGEVEFTKHDNGSANTLQDSLSTKINTVDKDREQKSNVKSDRHIIWSNANLDFSDWVDDLRAEYPYESDDGLYELMHEINSSYLDDERMNLDIQLNQPILVIADLGQWDGRRDGYKEIMSGNIKDCLYSDTDMTEWYVDKQGDLRADAYHHDGTNHYLYRVYKDNISDTQKENLKNKIYEGSSNRADITKITKRLGDEIAKVYGWEISKQRQMKGQER